MQLSTPARAGSSLVARWFSFRSDQNGFTNLWDSLLGLRDKARHPTLYLSARRSAKVFLHNIAMSKHHEIRTCTTPVLYRGVWTKVRVQSHDDDGSLELTCNLVYVGCTHS